MAACALRFARIEAFFYQMTLWIRSRREETAIETSQAQEDTPRSAQGAQRRGLREDNLRKRESESQRRGSHRSVQKSTDPELDRKSSETHEENRPPS